mgnify:CR=1 FL=1
MSIFKSNEGEMARFDRHMKPIRLLNENRRLKLIREELKRAKKSEQELLEQELKSLSPLQLELPLKRPI